MSNTYSIQVLAREFQTTARTLRFYETEGLLHPERRGTTRIFSEQDRARLGIALRARKLGLSLEEIRGFIDLYDAEPREDARQTLQRLARIAVSSSGGSSSRLLVLQPLRPYARPRSKSQ